MEQLLNCYNEIVPLARLWKARFFVQAILLATGENNNLHPLTTSIPSPMIPIANRPVMALMVELLARYGLKRSLVSLYERGGSIEGYFGEGSRWGIQLEYLLQRESWGTAGSLKWAESQLHETFIVLPADSMIDLDIDAAIRFHHAHDGPVTMILHKPLKKRVGDGKAEQEEGNQEDKTNQPTALHQPVYDAVWIDAEGHISLEPTNGLLLSATRAYIIEPHILELVPPQSSYDIYKDLIPALLEANLTVYGFQMQGYWNRLDSFLDYQEAQKDFLKSATPRNNQASSTFPIRYPTIEGYPYSEGIWVGRDNIIHPNVRITPPVFIGDGCRIGRKVELGPGAVIGSNVIIDDEATVKNSTILDFTYVGQLVNLEERIVNKTLLIDINSAESVNVVDNFLLDEASPTSIGSGFKRILDLLLSIILLYILSQLIFLIGVATFISTGGHLLVRLPRIGRRPGRIRSTQSSTPQQFELLRFKTRHDDGKYTLLGKWLEGWELHRLPELWNVVQGTLGLVGVKPLSAEEAEQVHEEWQRRRYEHPAGFTGVWYIQTTDQNELDDVFIADAYYAATRTWRSDLKILLQTPKTWFNRRLKY